MTNAEKIQELLEEMEGLIGYINQPDIDDDTYNLNLVQSSLLELIEKQRK